MDTPDTFLAIKDEVVADITHYIDHKCPDPKIPYYEVDDGMEINILQVREEIINETALGKELAESWHEMRKLEKS